MALSPAEIQRLYRARQKDPSLRPPPRDLTAPKACRTCEVVKPLNEFSPDRRNADGCGAHCRSCTRTRLAECKRRLKELYPDVARARWAHDAQRWRAHHPELMRSRNRLAHLKWRLSDPDRARLIKRKAEVNRRAIKRGAFVETVDPQVVFIRDDGWCGICLGPVSRDERWHVDHVIPLARGGKHSYANVQLAHAHCNIAKGDALPLRRVG